MDCIVYKNTIQVENNSTKTNHPRIKDCVFNKKYYFGPDNSGANKASRSCSIINKRQVVRNTI